MKRVVFLSALFVMSLGTVLAQGNFKKGTYRLVVSFISKGSGIERKSLEQVNDFVQNHNPKISYETCQMGREGETNFLFQLSELKKRQQKKFIKELKKQIVTPDMVQVKENFLFDSPCRN